MKRVIFLLLFFLCSCAKQYIYYSPSTESSKDLNELLIAISVFGLFFYVIRKLKKKKEHQTSIQGKALEKELRFLKMASDEDDLIELYKKNTLGNKIIDEKLLTMILSKLVEIKSFPKGVMEWLTSQSLVYPPDYAKEDLIAVMDEFIAMRQGTLKDDIAVNAYLDGFISIDEALTCIDKTKYPQTIDALKSDMEDIRIRKILQKEKTKL